MTRDEFDVLIKRLEEVSRKHPRLFIARIAGLVTLAYGYLGLILLGTLALCLAMVAMVVYVPNGVTVKFALIGIIAFGGVFLALLRGLWVRLDPPKGQAVTRAQAPELFALLDELRGALDCRPFHHVLLVGDHNAAVVQIPRLGIFGWHQNYLLLGLPLMQSLAPQEFKAVLAHEFAHSSRGHGRFGNWLYRVRRTWDRVFEQMARQGSRGGFGLRKFIGWFWPIFNGHAFVLARANEYEADACSVRLAGADAAASALLRLPVDGSLINEKFWPAIINRANRDKDPPFDVMLAFGRTVKSGAAAEDAARWLRQAFLMETNNSDTHPCLKDRLRAIHRLPEGIERGEFPAPPPPPPQSAAEFFLGAHAETAAREMSDEWRRSISYQWAVLHERRRKLAGELAALEQPAAVPPDPELLWDKARKLMELHGDDAALPVLDQALALDPKHAGANFHRGRLHLKQDDPRGIEFVEAAMVSDPALTGDGCNLLYRFFTRTGWRDQLRPLEHRVDRFREEAALAQRERAQISANDTFIAHELKEPVLADLRKTLAAEPDLGSVAVARKQVQHFPKHPCFAVGLRVKVSWWKPRSSAANQKLVHRLVGRLKLPGHFLVFADEQGLKPLGKKVFAAPGAVVYERADKS